MTSYVVSLKQYNTQSRISPEILKQCSSNLAQESDIHHKKNRMTPTMLLPWQHSQLQSLSVKNQISPFAVFFKLNRGSSLTHKWFPY